MSKYRSEKNIELKEKQTLNIKLPNGETARISFSEWFKDGVLNVDMVSKEGFIASDNQVTKVCLEAHRVHLTRLVDEVSGYCELESPENGVAKVKK